MLIMKYNNLTAVLITFLRPEYTRKCVKSLYKQYKGINIIVGENGNYDEDMHIFLNAHNARYIMLPFDSGVCYGRNRLVEEVETDYILVGDDDFFYTKNAGVDKMFNFIQRHDEFSVICGRIFEKGNIRNYQGHMTFEDKGIRYTKFDNENGPYEIDKKTGLRYAKVDIAFNYFVARKKDIEDQKWDEKIKVAYEHSDWFIQLRHNNTPVCFAPDCVVVHKPEGVKVDIKAYNPYRMRKSDRLYFFQKHGLDYFIDMQGRTDRFKVEKKTDKYCALQPLNHDNKFYNRGDIIVTKHPTKLMREVY